MYTPIQLDKMRNFKYGMRALQLIEKQLKIKSVMKLMGEDNEISMDELSTLIWAGLVHEDKELTPEHVIDLIDTYSSINKIIPIVMEAFTKAMGEDTGEESKNVVKAAKVEK